MSAEIASRWAEERERSGFSQADMARKLGISRETMRKWETGLAPVGSEALSVAYAFGIDVQYVLTGIRAAPSSSEKHITTGAITGGVGIAQGHANVQVINTQRHVTQVRPILTPGEEHISESEAAILTELVRKILETEASLKKKPATPRAVWGALNRYCGVTQYRMIPATSFERARGYLNSWIGRLHSMASAPVKDGDAWRKRHYAYIKINTKTEDEKLAVQKYMDQHFGATSLTSLSNDELDKVYRYIAGRRARR